MTSLSPDQIADKWANNLTNAQATITAGVNAVTVSPTQKAAAAKDKYLAGVQAAVASGKYVRSLQRVDLATWQQAVLNKGLSRLAAGATAAKGKMSGFMSQWLPALAANVAKVKSMPSTTLQDRINRMVQMATLNANFKRS